MRFEKINENKVKIELTKEDLVKHNIKLTDIAFGSDSSRRVLHDIMTQAFDELEFEPDNLPLVIEAVPTSSFSINIFITKMRTEEEFEANVEKVAKQNEKNLQGLNLLEKFTNDFEKMTKDIIGDDIDISTIFKDSEDDLLELVEELDKDSKNSKDAVSIKSNKSNEEKAKVMKEKLIEKDKIKKTKVSILNKTEIIYKFEKIDDIIALSHSLAKFYTGKSRLYKHEDVYYILFDAKGYEKLDIVKLRLTLDEFGEFVSTHKVAKGFLNEHGKVILKSDVLKKLNKVID